MTDQNDHNALNNDPKGPALWGWPTYLSIAVAVAILIFAATMVDLRKVWQEIIACDKRFIVIGAVAHYATYIVRGMRWRRCLIHLPVKAGNGKFALLVFFYNFVDNLVPAKLGDVYAAHLARINFRIRRSAALGSIVFLTYDRCLDYSDAGIPVILDLVFGPTPSCGHLESGWRRDYCRGGNLHHAGVLFFQKEASRLDTGESPADD